MKKRLIYLILLVCFLWVHPMISFGEEGNVSTLKDFSYEVIFPENQRNKEVGYYDLLVQPGKNETIQLKLNNLSTHKMTLSLKFNSAKTNGSGVIEYGPNNFLKDPSLAYDFSEIVTGPDKVELEPKNNKVVTLTIRPPIEPFEGYIVGGIQVKPLDNALEKKKKGSDIVINEFAFLIGVLLSEGDVKKIKPELEFHSISVDTAKKSAQLILNFSNSQPVFAEDMTLTVEVTKKSNHRAIFELNKKNMRMAPNTQINVPIPLKYKLETSGAYTMKTQVALKNGESWSWEQDFDVSEKDIPKLNRQLIEIRSTSNYIIVLLLVLVIGFIFLLMFMRHKRKRASKYKEKKQKKILQRKER
ncbi:DUF916 and DUF3324 domain-containing protein [Enterococcus sp. AZ126]|uniref:DUF916 and DUF3324 domain-containing protein n=1 Tax=Enterococcus sp. AZ126 TaxID=2774635 RepID=UPI003F2563C8